MSACHVITISLFPFDLSLGWRLCLSIFNQIHLRHNKFCVKNFSITTNGLGLVNPDRVFSFYDELHAYLASTGIDGVKSIHPMAEYHAAARAVGGCAIYVSDKPGNHDFNLLKKLVLPDGSILRTKLPEMPCHDDPV
uniref:Uncharacterized protein n=1 Tax=Oryza rufipogon TaxID=4529 RepID=A0A0E0QHU4_ORYRU